MSKRDTKPQFTPTPPSSARPTSSRRSARPGRKLIRLDSDPTMPSKEDSFDRNTSPNVIEPTARQMLFSNFHVLPPIINSNCKETDNIDNKDKEYLTNRINVRDELMTDKTVARKKIPTEEAITPGEANNMVSKAYQDFSNFDQDQTTTSILIEDLKPERRRLYRKGDIFRDSESTPGDILLEDRYEGGEIVVSDNDKMSQFKIPLEPDENSPERLHLAFRISNQNRLERCFLPTDRIGDIIAFLKTVVSDHHDKRCILELFINDFPRRRLDQLRSTLSDVNIKDRTVIDVFISDDDDEIS